MYLLKFNHKKTTINYDKNNVTKINNLLKYHNLISIDESMILCEFWTFYFKNGYSQF